VLATELPERCIQPSRIAAHDRRSAMGKDGSPNVSLFTPFELTCDWSMADQGLCLPAHHRSPHRSTIADVDVDATKCVLRIGHPGDIGHIEKATAVC
jgi:hypothetical protein